MLVLSHDSFQADWSAALPVQQRAGYYVYSSSDILWLVLSSLQLVE